MGLRAPHLLPLKLLSFPNQLNQQPGSLQVMPELLPVFQLFLHCTGFLILLSLQEGRERKEELEAFFLLKVLSQFKPHGAFASKSPNPFLELCSPKAPPTPSRTHSFLPCASLTL